MPRYRVTIRGPNKDAMADLVRKYNIDVLDHGIRFSPDTGYIVGAFAMPEEIRILQENGYDVARHEDVDALGKARQREVGRGNRYTRPAPRRSQAEPAATSYLNVEEVESALLVAAAAPYSTITELIALPHLTWEGRQCHAIGISGGSGAERPGVYFLGGIHAREWGSCDILVNFVEQIEQAYISSADLTFGGKTFRAAEIKTIVDNLQIFVFPQANPDGRNYSMISSNSPILQVIWFIHVNERADGMRAAAGHGTGRLVRGARHESVRAVAVVEQTVFTDDFQNIGMLGYCPKWIKIFDLHAADKQVRAEPSKTSKQRFSFRVGFRRDDQTSKALRQFRRLMHLSLSSLFADLVYLIAVQAQVSSQILLR
jgi:hypothetical protein